MTLAFIDLNILATAEAQNDSGKREHVSGGFVIRKLHVCVTSVTSWPVSSEKKRKEIQLVLNNTSWLTNVEACSFSF